MENKDELPIMRFLDYEIRSSWWAKFISFNLGQDLSANYFAWKTRKKYKRYLRSWTIQMELETRLKNKQNGTSTL